MKRLLIILFLLLTLPQIMADPLEAEELELKLHMTNTVNIISERSDYRVDQMTARLSWVPIDTYRQKITSITTEPSSEMLGDELVFKWNQPKEKELTMRLESRIITNNDYFPITRKVEFPIQSLEPEFAPYLETQEIIDMNDDIRNLASELAGESDDMYQVVLDIAEWVNMNINYSLDTITAEASQKSSWVLENRRGVCDEMTSLFISMVRSLGIPARFVYGQAYTNTGVYADGWGGHGWAEVYFPGFGWVPFDPTYGEYGYVDAGHVKMGHSKDARRPSVKYSMTGRNARIQTGSLDIESEVTKEENMDEAGISVSAKVDETMTGLGSYNLITATVKNNDNIYKPVILTLSKPVEIEGNEMNAILLKPRQEQKVHWLVRVGQIDPRYTYTFPIKVMTDRKIEADASFKAKEGQRMLEKDDYEEIIEAQQEENVKPYSSKVNLQCDTSTENAYEGDSVDIRCKLSNNGNQDLEYSICFDEECERGQSDSGASQDHSFRAENLKTGVKNLIVKASNSEFAKTSYRKVNVIDESDVRIVINASEEAEYGETYNLRFKVEKESHSIPQNVRITLRMGNEERTWTTEDLDTPGYFEVDMGTKGFSFKNDVNIIVEHEDVIGKEYEETESITVKMTDLSIGEWMIVALNTIGSKIIGWLT